MNNRRGFLTVPVAILLAGLFIGLSVIYAVGRKTVQPAAVDNGGAALAADAIAPGGLNAVAPITARDHIFGDPNAPVKLIEFSDPECPFCKRFHATLQQLVAAYPQKVAWVYRHFPLSSLHSKAQKESEAVECAGELGGNAQFWAYLDRLMEVTPSNNGLDPAELPSIASYIGLDATQFTACLSSGRSAAVVQTDAQDAVASGGEGTPYSIVIGKNGKHLPISGALPYDMVEATVKQVF